MKAIIFGAGGQDAFFLNLLLKKNQIQTILVSTSNASIIGDVSDYSFVCNLVNLHKPDYIFHLAASSSTNHAFLFKNNSSISNGTINILESVKVNSPSTKVFLSGSAMQFENKGLPINEKTPFKASSHYSVARIHSVYSARYYREHFGLKIYVGYFFNHDSELRSSMHVNRKIIDELKLVSFNKKNKIILGNPSVKKEFNFAGDIVNAIWQLINQENVFEAVIGSGLAYSLQDWINIVSEILNIKKNSFTIEINSKFKPEYDILVSDPKLIKSIGWAPNLDINDLAKRMINLI